jgi:hypothetical protein
MRAATIEKVNELNIIEFAESFERTALLHGWTWVMGPIERSVILSVIQGLQSTIRDQIRGHWNIETQKQMASASTGRIHIVALWYPPRTPIVYLGTSLCL